MTKARRDNTKAGLPQIVSSLCDKLVIRCELLFIIYDRV